MKPGNSDDNEPDNAAEPDKADAAGSDTAKAGEAVADKTAADKTESDKTESDKTESDKTESDKTEQVKAESEAAESPAESPGQSPAESTGAEDATPKSKPARKAKAEDKAEDEADPEPLMVELEKAPPPPDEPVMPTAAEARRRRAELPRPRVLQIAFYLAIGSLVVGVFSAVNLFMHKADLVRDAQNPDLVTRPLKAAEAERAVSSLLWLYLVLVVTLGAFILLFAYKAQDGVRRARMMALIITLIMLLFQFLFFGDPIGQFSGLLAAIMIALMYLPSTREYFGPPRKIR